MGTTINKNPEGFLLVWLPLDGQHIDDAVVVVNRTRFKLVPHRGIRPEVVGKDAPLLDCRIPQRSGSLDGVPVLVLGCHQPKSLRVVDHIRSVRLGSIVGLRTLRLFRRLAGIDGLHLSVDLGVRIEHTLTSQFIEPGNAHLDRFHAVAEDRICLADALQAARGDDLVNRIVIERGTDDLRPPNEVVRELLVNLAELAHLLDEDLALRRLGSIRLLVGEVEAVKERFVENASAGEAAVVVALALGVRSRNDIEPIGRMHELADLLDHHTLTLKHGLKAHDLLRAEIDLVKQQDRATLEGEHDRTILPHGVAVNQPERSEQIALVSLCGDVDAEALALQLGADLLHHRGLAVARQTRDEHGREERGLHDGFDGREVSPRHVGVDLVGDERSAVATRHSENASRIDGLHRRSSTTNRLHHDGSRRRSGDRNRLRRSGFVLEDLRRGADRDAGSVSSATDLRDMEQTTPCAAGRILDDPRRRASHATLGGSGDEVGALHGRGRGDGGEGGNERGLLGRKSGSHSS